jgi:hypothetical protein
MLFADDVVLVDESSIGMIKSRVVEINFGGKRF